MASWFVREPDSAKSPVYKKREPIRPSSIKEISTSKLERAFVIKVLESFKSASYNMGIKAKLY